MQENQTQQQQQQQQPKENETQVFDFAAEFDSLINAHGKITPSLLTAVNRFFLYFSFFESLLFDCAGSQYKSVQYAKKLLEMGVVDKALLKKTYDFFSERYLGDGIKYDSLCGQLKHTSQETKTEYYTVMEAKTTDPQAQLALCLFVCFRLRNNLFHGPKWRYYLKGQEELLTMAGNLIHSILSNVPKKDDWEFKNILNQVN
ncbi:TPA: hypothetical protein ACHJBU_003993 [Klebsiella pneumoniae]|nr:hypothetical protein [Klebsiella pneumoniae]HDS2769400.1 hypothetical protein [Klebsiella pneumoniae subsp. pneumoniae]HDU5465918.1 hypothetical protein [Klebsiella pneumoniae subsp. pneumoniae]HDY8696005.1 hypothetical protein [Klebsiella pneumoniae]HED8833588.1 hypothetical protein [Klebsiella pneumoniae]